MGTKTPTPSHFRIYPSPLLPLSYKLSWKMLVGPCHRGRGVIYSGVEDLSGSRWILGQASRRFVWSATVMMALDWMNMMYCSTFGDDRIDLADTHGNRAVCFHVVTTTPKSMDMLNGLATRWRPWSVVIGSLAPLLLPLRRSSLGRLLRLGLGSVPASDLSARQGVGHGLLDVLGRDGGHGPSEAAEGRVGEAGDLCSLCGAVLEGDAADGVVRLEDEAAPGRLGGRGVRVGRGGVAVKRLPGGGGLDGVPGGDPGLRATAKKKKRRERVSTGLGAGRGGCDAGFERGGAGAMLALRCRRTVEGRASRRSSDCSTHSWLDLK